MRQGADPRMPGLQGARIQFVADLRSRAASAGSGHRLGPELRNAYTGGRQVVGDLPYGFTQISGRIGDSGIPVAIVYVLVVALVLWVVFDYLPLGRYLYVIGDSPR